MTREEKLDFLAGDSAEERLNQLRKLLALEGEKPEVRPQFANNHIHTTYSFSPYSPAAAVYFAREAGLNTAGIMDHDSIGGAWEFRQAGEILGVWVTCGLECRVDMGETALAGRRFNHPDQDGVAYMTIHSVMPDKYDDLQARFAPLRALRNVRNRAMTEKINALTAPLEVALDFDQDVLPLSLYSQGGTVTERHLLWALSEKLLQVFGPEGALAALEKLSISLTEKQKSRFQGENKSLTYDLLGILKAELVETFYIPAKEECLTLKEVVALSEEVGAILCYSYLGDVGESVTGDKRQAQYEDSFLEELFALLEQEGVRGITYMPSRNTREQIRRIRELSKRYGMTEISGEDINAPNQSFICEKLADPELSHLVEATWNLIEREKKG